MINVGGFGHSGNTALVDYLADHMEVCPVGYNYTETAILRSKWGLKQLFQNSDEVPLEFIRDCLLGIKRVEHDDHKPPVLHDFKRNARVNGYLGTAYQSSVDDMIQKIKCTGHAQESIKKIVSSFLLQVERLALDKYGSDNAVPLLRNDPAAANINLLSLVDYTHTFFVYRDVRDMMIDWVKYYNYPLDIEGCTKFIKQYVNKTKTFIKALDNLNPTVLERVSFVSFERLVQDSEYRKNVNVKLGISSDKTKNRSFLPEKSTGNIGIHRELPQDCIALLLESTQVINDSLKSKIQEFELENLK